MCGIAGWIGKCGVDPATILNQLSHRGPDSCGTLIDAHSGLIHTRLSILDLSPAGSQPMTNETGDVAIIFNGEIYNHAEIRQDLLQKGHVFKGKSDAEIIPHLYEEMGSKLFLRLRGMFAIAVVEKSKRKLVLGRDRFGIKPLFYSSCADFVAFASEINTLKLFPTVDLSLRKQALFDYTALLYVPGPDTFFAGIHSLEPGTFAEVSDGVVKQTRYEKPSINLDYGVNFSSAVNQAEDLLGTAVHRQIESDVPLGALLSGGIDSSLVSLKAQESLTHRLKTFNVRFPDKEYDETWAAKSVADHIKSDHETLDMAGRRGSAAIICRELRDLGQPFADTSVFPARAVCRAMRAKVKVALAGDGGDEGFGGYERFRILTKLVRARKWGSFTELLLNGRHFLPARSDIARRLDLVRSVLKGSREELFSNAVLLDSRGRTPESMPF